MGFMGNNSDEDIQTAKAFWSKCIMLLHVTEISEYFLLGEES